MGPVDIISGYDSPLEEVLALNFDVENKVTKVVAFHCSCFHLLPIELTSLFLNS